MEGQPGAATLSTENLVAGGGYSLIGHSDGRVVLIREGNNRASVDITEHAAAAGMTAAGIRRTQADITADGEISRPTRATPNVQNEQQLIITMIRDARGMAGL